jgi:glyoxylase-like metal-dependent hydrolase (beta-lactamase superfamily II)
MSGMALPYICVVCGTQYAPSEVPPARCAICDDERQYVPPTGPAWTSLEGLRAAHRNAFERFEPGVFGIGSYPEFAIGQRALLLCTPAGNVLWDCVSLIDDATVDIVTALGGVQAIAISHPHYYTTMVEWSRAFAGAPIHLHAADRRWVMRPDPAVSFWEGATREVLPGITLVHAGGHFAGGTVLHWAAGAEGRGVLCSGDILQVVPDTRYVSFMRSYPNAIPLPASDVQRIARVVAAFRFDRVYGAWWGRNILSGGQRAVRDSAARYVAWVTGERNSGHEPAP